MYTCKDIDNSGILERVIYVADPFWHMQIVYIKILKYSDRSSSKQVEVIEAFISDIKSALGVFSTELNGFGIGREEMELDTIKIFIGDGVILGFPFRNCSNLHMRFVAIFFQLMRQRQLNPKFIDAKCNFHKDRWCKCHDFYSVQCSMVEGNLFIFKDLNGGYNMAGSVLNRANRLAVLCEYDQIFLSYEVYKNSIDWTEVSENDFRRHVREIKNGGEVEFYQFVGNGFYVNAS